MSYNLVKSAFFAAALLAGPAYADSVPVTIVPAPAPAAQHHGACTDNVTFLSDYCAQLHRAFLAKLRDCMASAPANAQGYRSKYLLCNAQAHQGVGRFAG